MGSHQTKSHQIPVSLLPFSKSLQVRLLLRQMSSHHTLVSNVVSRQQVKFKTVKQCSFWKMVLTCSMISCLACPMSASTSGSRTLLVACIHQAVSSSKI